MLLVICLDFASSSRKEESINLFGKTAVESGSSQFGDLPGVQVPEQKKYGLSRFGTGPAFTEGS